MKKIILLTITVSAAIAAFFAIQGCACNGENDSLTDVKKERHLTNAFSKAKQQAVS